jgi:hypothetical protein
LAPGQYSVLATDEVSGRTGLAVVEIDDVEPGPGGSKLVNLATRGFFITGRILLGVLLFG